MLTLYCSVALDGPSCFLWYGSSVHTSSDTQTAVHQSGSACVSLSSASQKRPCRNPARYTHKATCQSECACAPDTDSTGRTTSSTGCTDTLSGVSSDCVRSAIWPSPVYSCTCTGRRANGYLSSGGFATPCAFLGSCWKAPCCCWRRGSSPRSLSI